MSIILNLNVSCSGCYAPINVGDAIYCYDCHDKARAQKYPLPCLLRACEYNVETMKCHHLEPQVKVYIGLDYFLSGDYVASCDTFKHAIRFQDEIK